MTRKFDWLLGAAFLVAPFYWWAVALFVSSAPGSTTDPKRLLLLVLVYPILEEIVFRGGPAAVASQENLGLAASFWRNRRKHSDQHRICCISFYTTAQHLFRRRRIAGLGIRIFSRPLR